MRFSEYLIPTLKEDPKEAQITSQKLMLRAGLIRKLTSGHYTYLPLGLKVFKNIENIIREEMDKAGALEFSFPILLPAELFKITGRWDLFKKELFKVKDRHENDFALGPTHEEAFTDFVKANITSYKDLPLILYQIKTKFRDEIRPRFGVMRGREFTMKDAYSFNLDEKSLDESYEKMRQAYYNIFKRLSLDTIPVKADSGTMGGSGSEEFMVKSSVGEETLAVCDCGYYANSETAKFLYSNEEINNYIKNNIDYDEISQKLIENYNKEKNIKSDFELVHTPNIKSIEDLEKFFNIPGNNFIKTLIYKITKDDKKDFIVILMEGNREVNEVKLANLFAEYDIELANDEEVLQVTNAPVGFAGPVGINDKYKIIADFSIYGIKNGITGGNKKDYHFKNVSYNNFRISEFKDIGMVKEQDLCPKCANKLKTVKGIEVGHIFKLGYKYSDAFDLTVNFENGERKKIIMGCYGIGVDRTMAAVIEQNHDEFGIIWPLNIAPFKVNIITTNINDEKLKKVSEDLYNKLKEKNIDVLWDDRDIRAGIKFKDSDLIGIPFKVVVGKSIINENKFEVKSRTSKESQLLNIENTINFLETNINNA